MWHVGSKDTTIFLLFLNKAIKQQSCIDNLWKEKKKTTVANNNNMQKHN